MKYYVNHLKSLYYIQSYILCGCALFSMVLFGNKLHIPNRVRQTSFFPSPLLNKVLGISITSTLLILVYFRYTTPYLPADTVSDIINLGKYFKTTLTQHYIDYLTDYTSPFLLFTGILGVGVIFYTQNFKQYAIPFLFIVSTIITIVYPRHSNTHYWLVRRYLVCVFPFIIFGSAALLDFILSKLNKRKNIQICAISLWLAISGYYAVQHNISLKTATLRSYIGVTSLFESHAEMFKSESDILIVDGSAKNATAYMLAMKYIFHIESLSPVLSTITDDEIVSFIENFKREKKNIFFCALTDSHFDRFGKFLELQTHHRGKTPTLGNTAIYKITGIKQSF